MRSKINYRRFRHSFASNLIRSGKSIKAVQMLMCHKNVTLTLSTYSHLLQQGIGKAKLREKEGGRTPCQAAIKINGD
jgi:site-specific recombinase XerD